MATLRQDDDHDRITHVDILNLLREDIREGFAQQREVLNAKFDAVDTRFDAVDEKVDAVDNKVEKHFAEHTAQASESKTGRRWLIGIAIGVGVVVAGLVGQYLPAIIQTLQASP